MKQPEAPLYFVQISDTHIGPSRDYRRHGAHPLPCAERVVALINELPQQPDFVVHTGDVVTNPHPVSYRLAAETFAKLEAPIYYVNGNHDRATDIHHFLPMGPKENLIEERELLAYSFEAKGYRFLIVDGHGPDEIDPHGLVSGRQLRWLRGEVATAGPPLVVFTHFPALPLNAPWMDANMRLVNWQPFHETLRPAGARLRGVFHGHVHQNMQTSRDGVLYVAVASVFAQFGAWPSDEVNRLTPEAPPGFNFVHLLPEQTIIHQHTFPRP